MSLDIEYNGQELASLEEGEAVKLKTAGSQLNGDININNGGAGGMVTITTGNLDATRVVVNTTILQSNSVYEVPYGSRLYMRNASGTYLNDTYVGDSVSGYSTAIGIEICKNINIYNDGYYSHITTQD